MIRKSHRMCVSVATCAAVGFVLAVTSRAAQLNERLPHNGNAVLTLDVAKLLDSPLAKSQNWQSKLISGYADRPLPVPATAKRVAMTAFIHPTSFDAIWQAAVAELPGEPRLEPVLQTQGGYPDTVGDLKAAWSPRDVYYVQLDQNTLGVLRPGDRQALMRWISTDKSNEPMSPYLTSALAGGDDAQVLFAVDLTNSAGFSAVNYAFANGKLPSLEKMENGREKLLAALGSVKGLTLKLTVDKEINGEMTADFDQPVDALGADVKALVNDVLNAAGLTDPQLSSWEFKASGKQIVGKGVCDTGAVGRLVAIMSPGDLAATDAPPMAKKPAKPNEPEAVPAADTSDASPAAASQAYYRAITKMFDKMSAKASPTESAAWLHAQARMIQQLPAVGVDPVLLEWGDQTSQAFDRAAQVLAVGQQNAQNAAAGIASPTASSVSWSGTQGGSSNDTPESRAAYRNAQQARRQAAQQQRAAAADQALGILNDAIATRGKTRTLMVQKYNVEF